MTHRRGEGEKGGEKALENGASEGRLAGRHSDGYFQCSSRNAHVSRRTFFGLASLGILALTGETEAEAQTLKLPPIMRAKFENGIEVALMEYRRAPFLSVVAQFRGGTVLDPEGKSGVGDLTAELLRKGTAKRTATQIAEEMDFLGGSLGTSADDDRVSVSLSVLTKDTETGLELFADVIRNATFPQEELERERKLQIAGLQSLADEPSKIAAWVSNEVIYSTHPYHREATITSLGGITREDITAYREGTLRPDRMLLVAVGDFRTAEILSKLKAHFGDWSVTGTASPLSTVQAAYSAPRFVLVDKKDATQTQARWGKVALPRNHPDYFAAEVASNILGGGFTSRLVDEIRVNRSLTYGIGGRFGMKALGGSFVVSTFTKIETTRALIDAVSDVLKKTVEKGFTAAELKKMQGFIPGQFAIGLQTPGALAANLADIVFYHLPENFLTTYIEKLRAVTLADVNRIAREHFTPSKLSLVLVAPAAKIASQLNGLPNAEKIAVETIGK